MSWFTEVNTYADNIRPGYCLVPLNEQLPAIGKQGGIPANCITVNSLQVSAGWCSLAVYMLIKHFE